MQALGGLTIGKRVQEQTLQKQQQRLQQLLQQQDLLREVEGIRRLTAAEETADQVIAAAPSMLSLLLCTH